MYFLFITYSHLLLLRKNMKTLDNYINKYLWKIYDILLYHII